MTRRLPKAGRSRPLGVSETQDVARAGRRISDGERRRQLLAAAAQCFDELGLAATTVEAIAARANTSRPTFYAYFRSKDEAFLALVEAISTDLVATQTLGNIETAPPAEVLAATTRAYAETIFANGGLVGLIDVVAASSPEVNEIWAATHRRTVRRFANYLSRLDPASIDPVIDPAALVQMIGDSIHQGAKRLSGASADEKERFILNQIAVTLRLAGIPDHKAATQSDTSGPEDLQ